MTQASRPRRLLFVCTGNICRSLMAERMALKLAADRGLPLEAKSCGLAAESYYTPPREVDAALKPLFCDGAGHRPQLVSRDLLRWCDLALVMTARHKAALLDAFPEFTGKVALLREHAGLDQADVADPMGRPQPVFDACRESLAAALDRILRA